MMYCQTLCIFSLWYCIGFQGICGEACAEKYGISREAQDDFAISSYQRSQAAAKAGVFEKEIVPVTVPQKKGKYILLP